MPPRTYRRRTAAEDHDVSTPARTQPSRQQVDTPPEEVEDVDMEDDEDTGSANLEQLSKALVRYALSCEYARRPIKRPDVVDKVLGTQARLFKSVFARANSELQDVFGMHMVELAAAEKVTMRQKRTAAASQSQNKSTNMWVLQTTLPDEYRIPEVLGPSRPLAEGHTNREDAYVGLYTMVITLIMISGGKMAEGKLDRALRRMNADQTTPLGTKDKTLAAMIKDGYIVRVKETVSGDETVDYIVGPRGKVEVGREGAARLMRAMHGEDEQNEELEEQIQRTLDAAERFNGGVATGEGTTGPWQVAGHKRGRRQDDDNDDG